MKRITKITIGLVLVGVLSLGLCGCGDDAAGGAGNDETKVEQQKEAAKEKKEKKEKEEKKEAEKKKDEQKSSKSSSAKYCTVSIDCKKLLSIKKDLDPSVAKRIPGSGVILGTVKVKIGKGDTVLDVTKDVTRYYGIQMAYQGSSGYGTAYVQGIHNIYEKDGGSESGWKYYVNGSCPSRGCSAIKVHSGDSIVWSYALTI